ncbi:MAG: hypothetical protein WCE61_13710 [Candidatus Acidiferrum sp.]
MSSKIKAMVTLVIIAPLLTEMVSGNTPAHAFLKPQIALFLLMAYGFPLLIIREFSLRRRLSKFGVFCLGLAYGIVNEGLLAQTLLRWEHVPIDKFDHYFYVAGFNLSWALVIVPWHALFAVFFPLVLVASWFPKCAKDLWLEKRSFAALTTTLVALLVFIPLARKPHPQMIVCMLTIAAFVFIASLFRNGGKPDEKGNYSRTVSFLLGMAAYPVLFLSPIILAAKRVSAPVYFIAVPAILILLAVAGWRAGVLHLPGAAPLALGAYFSMSIFQLFGGIRHHSAEAVATGAFFASGFLVLAGRHPARLPGHEGVC